MADIVTDDLGATLLALEERAWWALSRGEGGDFYREHLTEDALMVFPFGVLSRRQSIEAMEAAPPWASFRIDEPRALRLSSDSALLTYRATAQRFGQEPYAAFMTTVFVRQGGSWKTAYHQQSPVAD